MYRRNSRSHNSSTQVQFLIVLELEIARVRLSYISGGKDSFIYEGLESAEQGELTGINLIMQYHTSLPTATNLQARTVHSAFNQISVFTTIQENIFVGSTLPLTRNKRCRDCEASFNSRSSSVW